MPNTFRCPSVIVLAAALVLAAADMAVAQQAVIAVRHAERADQSRDPPLGSEGRARAGALAALLKRSGITHIVTSEFLRTRETAAPLAAALGLTPEQVPARDLPALVARLRALDPASIVLVVGHSNTIPPLVGALGGPTLPDLPDGDHHDVFVLVPRQGQPTAMVRLTYGQGAP
jgi:broad specificity phosphatase PhoE